MRRETTAKVLQIRMINIAPSHPVVRVFVEGTFGQTGSSKLSSVAVEGHFNLPLNFKVVIRFVHQIVGFVGGDLQSIFEKLATMFMGF